MGLGLYLVGERAGPGAAPSPDAFLKRAESWAREHLPLARVTLAPGRATGTSPSLAPSVPVTDLWGGGAGKGCLLVEVETADAALPDDLWNVIVDALRAVVPSPPKPLALSGEQMDLVIEREARAMTQEPGVSIDFGDDHGLN